MKILNSRSSGNAVKGCSLFPSVYDKIIQLLKTMHTPRDQCIVSHLGMTPFYEMLQLGHSRQKKKKKKKNHEIKQNV